MNPVVYLVAALVVLAFVLYSTRERFAPQFFDTRQVKRTVAAEDSHYGQYTNHMDAPSGTPGSLTGMPTPFRVNQYTAYIQ